MKPQQICGGLPCLHEIFWNTGNRRFLIELGFDSNLIWNGNSIWKCIDFTFSGLTRHVLISQLWFRNFLVDSNDYFLFLVLKPVDSTIELQWHDLFNLKGINDTSTMTPDIADNEHVRPVEDQHGVVSVSCLTENSWCMFFFRISKVYCRSWCFDLQLSTCVNQSLLLFWGASVIFWRKLLRAFFENFFWFV